MNQVNAQKIMHELKDFGFGSLNIELSDLLSKDQVIQLGYSPIRINLLPSISGVGFENAYQR